MYSCVRPICCPPKYCVRDHYAQRFIPVIQPIVTINRQNIIDVPQVQYQQITRNVVVNQGFQPQPQPQPQPQAQGQGRGRGFLGGQGFANRSLF